MDTAFMDECISDMPARLMGASVVPTCVLPLDEHTIL